MGPSSLIPIVVILAGAVAVVIIVMAVAKYQSGLRRKREESLALVARQLGGTVVKGSFWKQPVVQFEHRGLRASLEFYSTGGKNPTYYTRLFFRYSSPAFNLHIYPERWLSRVGKWLGSQDIQIGDANFDDKFMIKGSDQSRVLGFLSPEVRQAIFELRALKMNDHIDLSTQKDALRIQKLSWLEAADLLTSFASLGMQVFDGYLEAAQLAPSQAPTIPEPVAAQQTCGVCADVISGSTQTCPRCQAPHHPECWELNDGCGKCNG